MTNCACSIIDKALVTGKYPPKYILKKPCTEHSTSLTQCFFTQVIGKRILLIAFVNYWQAILTLRISHFSSVLFVVLANHF